MKIKIKYLLLVFLVTILHLEKSYSQISTEYESITKMSPNDSIMYSLLKECISLKIKDSSSLHFFPLYKTFENDSTIHINTIVYTKQGKYTRYPRFYPNKDGVTSYSLLFNKKRKNKTIKNKEFDDNVNVLYLTDEKEIEKTIKYVIAVYETDAKAITGRGIKRALLYRTQQKPLFDKILYDYKIIFKTEKPKIVVDTTLYKNLKYDVIKYIDKDYAVLKYNNEFGVITSKNDTLIPFEFNDINHYSFGFSLKKNQKYSLISSDAKIKSQSYENIAFGDIKNNFFIAQKNGLYTFLDINTFKELIPREYKSYERLYRDFIITTKNNGHYIININDWKETRYDSLYVSDKQYFNDQKELIIQAKRNNSWGLISLFNDERQILDFKYQSIDQYNINSFNNINMLERHLQPLTYAIKKNGKYALFNCENSTNWITDFEYDELYLLNDKFVGRKKKGHYLIGLNGIIISDKYDEILLDLIDNRLQFIGIKNNKREIINLD